MDKPLFPEVIVNGQKIPTAAIAAEAQHHDAPAGKPGVAWRQAANALVVRALLTQEAARRDIEATPEEVAPGKWETEEEARIRGLLEDAIETAPPPEAEIRAEWARDPTRFRAPPLWEASHILLACDPRDPDRRHAAEAVARELSRKILARPDRFSQEAEANSDCASRAEGGRLGQLRPGDTVPEFEAALRGLVAGGITAEPVLSRFGWHIIRLDAVAEGAPLPYDAVRPRIAEAMERAAWTAAVRDFVASLAAEADISGADLAAA
ncbi:peptidase [Defluviimonas sp. 20V17]|uniref:Parvulin-like PPIase n=1 Tax=Allgaiera indica TaxID=765699 RepID=A0AAN4ZZA4_9RHOB|nr:peptidylprolyl isomerase [Allgaiera indica]KDB03081.1 peptidase [Defluviimonas sp. 20V17]GHE00824.1 peptidylprolyl isomerase [Allgaiera indica]SDW72367.1 peptidyl-prolyl cis-trans isomerase C [Allgaiera indica]